MYFKYSYFNSIFSLFVILCSIRFLQFYNLHKYMQMLICKKINITIFLNLIIFIVITCILMITIE